MSSIHSGLRKSHALRRFVFNSFVCNRLAPTVLPLLLPIAAAAQATFDPVIVTGTREPQLQSRSTADVVVINSDTIRNSTADTVEDLLRREAGIQTSRNGGPGQTASLFLRGASATGTLVLVDGVRVGSASLGYAEIESMSLAQIDHIEVLRGPASSLYGADAVGGVVQIFTRRGQGAPRMTAGVALGGYKSRQYDAGVSGTTGEFDYAASLARESSGGVSALRPNDQYGYYNADKDGYQRNSGNLQLGYAPARGHRIGINLMASNLNSRYDSADFDPVTFIPNNKLDFQTRLRTRVESLDYRGVVSDFWTTTAQVSRNVDDSTSGATRPSRFKTERDQATWQNALHITPDQQVVLAYEHLAEKLHADGFATVPKRDNNAVVIGYSGQFGANGVEASLRQDHNSVYGNNTTGSIGYAYQLTSQWKLRGLVGNTFRAPTFNELFYPNYGLTTVKAERGRSVELGAGWRSGVTTADATVYRNKIRHLIGYDPDPNGTDCPRGYFGCAANIARATLQGATITAGTAWGGLTVHGIVDFLDARDDDTRVRLVRRAAHQETVTADYNGGPWTVGASVVDVGSRPDGGKVLGGYGLVDLRATWRVMPKWRLEAKVLNALDHRNEPLRDYQGLGRQAWIGMRYDGAGL